MQHLISQGQSEATRCLGSTALNPRLRGLTQTCCQTQDVSLCQETPGKPHYGEQLPVWILTDASYIFVFLFYYECNSHAECAGVCVTRKGPSPLGTHQGNHTCPLVCVDACSHGHMYLSPDSLLF